MFDRKAHWQDIYKNKSCEDVSWYQQEPLLSLDLIHSTQITHNDAIIDVGGGASVLVDHLYDEGFSNLSVLDISANALSCAKERLGDAAKDIAWLESDVTQFKAPQSYSLWHDRAVFHFLTEAADRKSYVNVLKQALTPKGHLIIAAFSIGGPDKCSGLDIVQYDAEKIMTELGEDFKLINERNETHITPGDKEQTFMYFHFVYSP